MQLQRPKRFLHDAGIAQPINGTPAIRDQGTDGAHDGLVRRHNRSAILLACTNGGFTYPAQKTASFGKPF